MIEISLNTTYFVMSHRHFTRCNAPNMINNEMNTLDNYPQLQKFLISFANYGFEIR